MSEHAIETLLDEERRFPPPAGVRGAGEREADVYAEPFEAFWERNGRERVTWFEPFDELYRLGAAVRGVVPRREAQRRLQLRRPSRRGGARRPGCLPLGGRARGRHRAITYAELQRDVVTDGERAEGARGRQGHGGRDLHGDGAGVAVAMLACTRLGAPHTVVFGGFSADSLSDRMNDMGCEVLVTQDEAWRRGSPVPLKRVADEAMAERPGVRAVARGAPHRQRGADDGGPRPLASRARRSPTTRRPARASRWTARISSS